MGACVPLKQLVAFDMMITDVFAETDSRLQERFDPWMRDDL